MTGDRDAYARALARLALRARLSLRFGLDRVRGALDRLGAPQRELAAVHVAGTNGKGSTAAMIASCARAAGLRVGLYTSPHLCRFSERIQVAGREIDRGRLAALLERVLELDPELTFFEAATAAAFRHFADERVELAVVETGLGGRLDATNVLERPLAVVLTSIDLDHQELLGHDLASIAREKAGIIKAGVPVIAARPASAEVARVLRATAAHRAPTLRFEGESFRLAPADGALRFESERGARLSGLALALGGSHQLANAALCLAALEELGARGLSVPESAQRDGLAEVRWPGRLEAIDDQVLVDGAHNPSGAHALARALAERGLGPYTLIAGLLGPKNSAETLAPLVGPAAHTILTRPRSDRALDPRSLAVHAPGAELADDLAQALAMARARPLPIVVAGSLYLVGEARALVLGEEQDPVALADPR